jgi:hypothetical protein
MCRPLTGALSLRTPRRVMDAAGVFDLLLARGNEADFQCLRFDDHARDMAFDQLAIRGRRRGLPVTNSAGISRSVSLN